MLLTTKNQLKIILLFKLENHLMIQIYMMIIKITVMRKKFLVNYGSAINILIYS